MGYLFYVREFMEKLMYRIEIYRTSLRSNTIKVICYDWKAVRVVCWNDDSCTAIGLGYFAVGG